jgi:hypothetical protein
MEMVLYDATVAEWGQDLRSMGFLLLCPLFFFLHVCNEALQDYTYFQEPPQVLSWRGKKTFLAARLVCKKFSKKHCSIFVVIW